MAEWVVASPTDEGWYWHKIDEGFPACATHVIRGYPDKDVLFINDEGEFVDAPNVGGLWWSERIPEPVHDDQGT